MPYHTPLVQYTHRCGCGECLNVVTNSPALPHDENLERQLAHDVMRIHRAILGLEVPELRQYPPGFEQYEPDA